MPTIKELNNTHPEYNKDLWLDLGALYAGGQRMRKRMNRFLPQNAMEPAAMYDKRLSEASYRSFIGPIVDYYTAWLFSGAFAVRARQSQDGDPVDPDEFYAEFREDVGGDVDLVDFMRERFTTALVKKRAHILCELPESPIDLSQANKAEWEQLDLGRATLSAIDPEDMLYWETDERGTMLWCVLYSCSRKRNKLTLSYDITETWRIVDAQDITTYSITYPEKEPPSPDTELSAPVVRPHRFKQLPLITLEVPEGLWLCSRVMDAQLSYFRLASALEWNLKQTCYAMPVFNVMDKDNPPTPMGAGYYVMIGIDEKFQWGAPPTDHLVAMSKEVDARRNDIFRMAHQMALGMDNNAETVGRSADSKEQDNAATRVMLNAYGAIVTETLETIYEVVSDARNDEDVFWSIEGLAGYDTATAPELIANAENAQLLNIPSKTFLREIKTKTALALLPETSQNTKDAIRQEITDAVNSTGDLLELVTTEPPIDAANQKAAGALGGAGPKKPKKPAA